MMMMMMGSRARPVEIVANRPQRRHQRRHRHSMFDHQISRTITHTNYMVSMMMPTIRINRLQRTSTSTGEIDGVRVHLMSNDELIATS